MSDIEEVSGKSGKDIAVGDKTYHLRDITVGDNIAFLGVLKEDQRLDAKRLLIDLKEAGLKDEVVASEYHKELTSLKLQPVDITGNLDTIKGARYYFWRAVQGTKLTQEQIAELITEDNWISTFTQMDDLFLPLAKRVGEAKKKKEEEQKPVNLMKEHTPGRN